MRKKSQAARSAKSMPIQTAPAAFDEALRLHQAGRLAEAEALYRQVLATMPQHADSLHLLGVLAFQTGRFDEAVAAIERAIQAQKNTALFHASLGNALKALGRLDEAVAQYDRALALKADYADALNNRGIALNDLGRLDEAMASYERALTIQPDFAEAHNNLGMLLQNQRRPEEAIAHYTRALALRPDLPEAHNNLGFLLCQREQLDEALAHYERAIALRPDYAEAHSNMGNVFKERDQLDEAVRCYERAIALSPTYANAHNNLGLAAQEQGRIDEAMAMYRHAIALRPGFAEAYNNLGFALQEQNRFDEALAEYAVALGLEPGFAEAHMNRGNALKGLGRFDEALAAYRRAIELAPDHARSHWNQALTQLMLGDFAAGWAGYEWRWKTKDLKPHRFTAPLWDGSALNGRTILLHCEQGLGDGIQFARYAPLVQQRGGRVVLACPAPLAVLFRTLDGVDQLITDGDAVPPHDVQAPLLSLPGLFGTDLASIPAAVPYLRPDPAKVAVWRERLAALRGRKVGVVWRGNPKHGNDSNRSMTAQRFAAFLDQPGLAVVSLQKDARPDELAALDPAAELGDFSDTAALVANLDLVIAVDTSVAHLAGALNVPTWVLLPFVPDWRWLLGRADCPWYPSARLFRQPALQDWDSVVRCVRDGLKPDQP